MALPLKTVVIADDDAAIVTVLKEILLDSGYEVVGTARNGLQAVEMAKSHKPNVILLDIHMPMLDGLEAARQVAALGGTAIVVLTGDTDPALARAAMDAGASAYMQKPFELSQIRAILESAWHRFQTIQALQEQTRQLTESLEVRKLMEKAKGILMEQQGFTESQAHQTLQKMSQDQGIPLKDVCRSIIQVRMVLGSKARSAVRKNVA